MGTASSKEELFELIPLENVCHNFGQSQMKLQRVFSYARFHELNYRFVEDDSTNLLNNCEFALNLH